MPKLRVTPSSSKLTSAPQAAYDEEYHPVVSAQHSKRTEYIPLSRILPDEYQARVILPAELAARFYGGEIDCYTVAKEWLELANQNDRARRRVESLLDLGISLVEDGQIKNATGSWQMIGEQAVFVLETGERRFWGMALRAVQRGFHDEPVLEAVSVPEPNRVRQVVENERSEPPTAVSRARAIAGLINYFYDIHPEPGVYSRYGFHRLALGIRVSMKTWAELERVFKTSRNHLVEHLKLLEISDHLLDLADDYAVPERALREIRQHPAEQWEQLIWDAIENKTTTSDLQISRSKIPRRPSDPTVKAARRIKGALVRLSRGGAVAIGPLADSLFAEYDDTGEVLQAADQLEDLAIQLRVRVEGQQS